MHLRTCYIHFNTPCTYSTATPNDIFIIACLHAPLNIIFFIWQKLSPAAAIAEWLAVRNTMFGSRLAATNIQNYRKFIFDCNCGGPSPGNVKSSKCASDMN